ncbi:type I-E CRISPR-associated protein Cas6/Cse3/CasE [Thermomonospora catenispora]|uniref:type I-E CRISPR-associated protein Cas6/Cse3/CasE n=1 Tax=Thermomonospora catenispora TaxID=2493090 RepID=UPI001122610E|nr:type I-E CRISPR-associated protein Cas6/Cse3/CasE [Thermomonospora catenispora]TNY35117.1 type I-E CRISPR-associated protein Cas6/Cse3/CasE [Thermomonospora catenispora]
MNTELWITQIIPDPRDRAALDDLRDVVRLHRRIMSLFPDGLGPDARRRAAVLFRLETRPAGAMILMQSAIEPALEKLPASYGTARCKSLNPLLSRLHEGANVHYRIVANATRKLGRNTTAGRPKQVVPLQGAEADEWWRRQADTAGLVLRSLHSRRLDDGTGRRPDNSRVTHARTQFDGTATVTDPKALIDRICTGIGRGKAYGCGLLTIAPAP